MGHDHVKYRMLTQGWRGAICASSSHGWTSWQTSMSNVAEMGGECDFVKDVAIWYPLRVIMSIFGVPEEDEPLMSRSPRAIRQYDPDVNRAEPLNF